MKPDMNSATQTILTVDDEPFVRKLICTFLERAGFRVLEANGAAQALEIFTAQPEIAAVLTDIRMPGMDGNELARKLIDLRPALPLAFVSAFETDREEDLQNYPALVKPFTCDQLLERVTSLLSCPAFG